MSVIQIGLVDHTGKLDPGLVHNAAMALNLQVTRDLPQFWPISATVAYLPSPHKIPAGVWPVQLVKTLPPGEGGFHSDKHKQPYSKVIASPDDNTWTIDASHEILEMLVDPFGNTLHSSAAIEIVGHKIEDGTGQFGYLVEACDPCEDNSYAYTINGIAVSDFITPHYYDLVTTPGTRYSFCGHVTAPRRLLPGGYISFVNNALDEWQQILWLDPKKAPQLRNLGPAPADKSLREWIDSLEPSIKANKDARSSRTPAATKTLEYSAQRIKALDAIAETKARRYSNHP